MPQQNQVGRAGDVDYSNVVRAINEANQAADAFLQFAQTVNAMAAEVQRRSNQANASIQTNLSNALESIRLEKENALNEIRRERANSQVADHRRGTNPTGVTVGFTPTE